MIQFELTHQESELLHKILDWYRTEIGVQRAMDGSENFGEQAQAEATLLERMLAQLSEHGMRTPAEEIFGEYIQ